MTTKTQVTLQAEPRTVQGKQVRQLRREGVLPARIFGHGDSLMVQVDERTVQRMRETHQTAGLITLNISGQKLPETVMITHIEHEPKTAKMLHIDFARVVMNEVIHSRVPLRLVGESLAAKNSGGALIPLLEAIEIECLPGNLPDSLNLDVSILTSMDMVLHASDITLPAGVKLLIHADEAVVKVQALRGEAATTPAPEAAATTPAPSA